MFGFEEVLRDPFLLLIVVFMVVAFVTGLVLLVCVAWQWGKVRKERRLACRLVQHYSILWFRLDLGPRLPALSPLPRPRFFCSVNLPLVARNHVSQKPEVSFNLGPIPPRTGHEHSYHCIPLSIRLQVSPDLRPLNRRDYSRVHS